MARKSIVNSEGLAVARPPVTGNPHTWMDVNPDTDHTPKDYLYGVLNRTHEGRQNSAAEFARCKLLVDSTDTGEWVPRAERHDVLLPLRADDVWRNPQVLFTEVDRRISGKQALVSYATLFFRSESRWHHSYELVRHFAYWKLAIGRGLPVLVAQHVPSLAGSSAPLHVHLCIVPRTIGLGLANFDTAMCGPQGQKLIHDLWLEHRRTL